MLKKKGLLSQMAEGRWFEPGGRHRVAQGVNPGWERRPTPRVDTRGYRMPPSGLKKFASVGVVTLPGRLGGSRELPSDTVYDDAQ